VRLVFGESDGLPGLVADLYGEHLVVQVLTAAVARRIDLLLDALGEHRRIASVLARNDPSVRTLEGLAREVTQLRGTTPERVEVQEHGLRWLADLWRGQKTGAFLDQAENRAAAGRLARGRVLDAFAYHGSFALHAARAAEEVVVLESSGEALARARESAGLNGLTNLVYVEANAFDELRARERAGERFDVVLLDPPAFAKSRHDIAAALRGYREINLRAMRLLAPGGVLVTSSCSYNLGEEQFYGVLAEAAADAGVDLRVVERRIQAQDHPVRLGFPESLYLKCAILASAECPP
jgi:23S rRNA (cytosine1962-C5)-methyltransferase